MMVRTRSLKWLEIATAGRYKKYRWAEFVIPSQTEL